MTSKLTEDTLDIAVVLQDLTRRSRFDADIAFPRVERFALMDVHFEAPSYLEPASDAQQKPEAAERPPQRVEHAPTSLAEAEPASELEPGKNASPPAFDPRQIEGVRFDVEQLPGAPVLATDCTLSASFPAFQTLPIIEKAMIDPTLSLGLEAAGQRFELDASHDQMTDDPTKRYQWQRSGALEDTPIAWLPEAFAAVGVRSSAVVRLEGGANREEGTLNKACKTLETAYDDAVQAIDVFQARLLKMNEEIHAHAAFTLQGHDADIHQFGGAMKPANVARLIALFHEECVTDAEDLWTIALDPTLSAHYCAALNGARDAGVALSGGGGPDHQTFIADIARAQTLGEDQLAPFARTLDRLMGHGLISRDALQEALTRAIHEQREAMASVAAAEEGKITRPDDQALGLTWLARELFGLNPDVLRADSDALARDVELIAASQGLQMQTLTKQVFSDARVDIVSILDETLNNKHRWTVPGVVSLLHTTVEVAGLKLAAIVDLAASDLEEVLRVQLQSGPEGALASIAESAAKPRELIAAAVLRGACDAARTIPITPDFCPAYVAAFGLESQLLRFCDRVGVQVNADTAALLVTQGEEGQRRVEVIQLEVQEISRVLGEAWQPNQNAGENRLGQEIAEMGDARGNQSLDAHAAQIEQDNASADPSRRRMLTLEDTATPGISVAEEICDAYFEAVTNKSVRRSISNTIGHLSLSHGQLDERMTSTVEALERDALLNSAANLLSTSFLAGITDMEFAFRDAQKALSEMIDGLRQHFNALIDEEHQGEIGLPPFVEKATEGGLAIAGVLCTGGVGLIAGIGGYALYQVFKVNQQDLNNRLSAGLREAADREFKDAHREILGTLDDLRTHFSSQLRSFLGECRQGLFSEPVRWFDVEGWLKNSTAQADFDDLESEESVMKTLRRAVSQGLDNRPSLQAPIRDELMKTIQDAVTERIHAFQSAASAG